jgi:uncharacterized protein (DUF2336 family)
LSAEGTIDTNYLFKLARDKSSEGRAALASVINGLFDEQGEAITDRERHLMMNILHGLVHEVEVSVRRNISARLAQMPDAPIDLIQELANDDIDVAYPILTQSKVLRDEDLVDVIRLRTHEHQLAVTLRTDISEDVSAALVEQGNEQVVVSLLKNQTAKISQATLEFLIDESRRMDSFQDPLLHREDLREDLAKRMFMWVSAALRRHIVERYALDADTVDDLLEQAAREEINNTIARKPAAGQELRRTLSEEGVISPNMVVAALLDGEASLFLKLFSALTNLNDILTSRIIFEEGGEALAIACKAVDVPEMQFSVIYDRTRKARAKRMSPQDAAKRRKELLDLYHRILPEDAAKVLRRWQRGSDFLSAIRELDL